MSVRSIEQHPPARRVSHSASLWRSDDGAGRPARPDADICQVRPERNSKSTALQSSVWPIGQTGFGRHSHAVAHPGAALRAGGCENRVMSDNEDKPDVIRRFPVRRGNEFTFVQVGDVDWIEGLGDYAGLHVGDRTHLVREPLTLL